VRAAIYARYSTELQTESSIIDQNRICERWCEANDANVVARFEDQGISGGAIGNRPGLAMLLAAPVDVVVVMDLSRLSRSQADLPKMIDRLVHRGVRIIGVQDGYDSSRKGHKLQAGLSGIIGEAFRDMVSSKTYSALESRAQRGQPTGGRAFGYRNGEAATVLRIFKEYADGVSAKGIAEQLNREGVPSPGSSWDRTTRRRGGWAPSAIAGDPRRFTGILNNEIYVGRDVWNRTRWSKDPDSGRRVAVQRPKCEWIVKEAHDKRLVPDDLWNRVKARQAARAHEVGDRIKLKLKQSTGRGPRYMFSSLLKCKVCGSNYVMADATHYSCSGYVNGRICGNRQRTRRDVMESKLLTGIRTTLLSDQCVNEFKAKIMRPLCKPGTDASRLPKLEREVANYVDAIGQGFRSATLLDRLRTAEAELERLRNQSKVVDVKAIMKLLPVAIGRYRAAVEDLGNIGIDMQRARETLREMLGTIPIRPGCDGVPIAELSLDPISLVAAGGSQIGLVGGHATDPRKSIMSTHRLEITGTYEDPPNLQRNR
jgi:DNA invertase Pin-like site-specific DNA recombinase